MKRIAITACIFLASFCSKSYACLNYYVIDGSGHRNMHDDYPPSNIYIHSKYEVEELKLWEEKIPKASQDDKFKYISNYCACLVKLGRYKEAIPILQNLLKEKPNEYELNANIAVAFELDGKIDEALAYLRKSIMLNSGSHMESEWFHLRILEAAIELRDKKTNLQAMDVLKRKDDKSKQTGRQISYQLKERVPLTKPANSLLCKVIEESADYYDANISLEWAIELYAIAIGYTADSSVEKRLWQKINSARSKLMEFKKQGKQGTVSKYLYNANWQKEVKKQADKWRNYKPYYYDKEIMTTF